MWKSTQSWIPPHTAIHSHISCQIPTQYRQQLQHKREAKIKTSANRCVSLSPSWCDQQWICSPKHHRDPVPEKHKPLLGSASSMAYLYPLSNLSLPTSFLKTNLPLSKAESLESPQRNFSSFDFSAIQRIYQNEKRKEAQRFWLIYLSHHLVQGLLSIWLMYTGVSHWLVGGGTLSNSCNYVLFSPHFKDLFNVIIILWDTPFWRQPKRITMLGINLLRPQIIHAINWEFLFLISLPEFSELYIDQNEW